MVTLTNSVSFVISCKTVSCSRFDLLPIVVTFLRSDLLQVLSILAMERPVSFAAEDIRDEKVLRSQAYQYKYLLTSVCRSRYFVLFHLSKEMMSFSVNTLPLTGSLATSMMIRFLATLFALRLPLPHSGSTILGGKVSLSFSKQEKVCLLSTLASKYLMLIPWYSTE